MHPLQKEPATHADGHLPVLDGVRGIAILSVLIFHVSVFPGEGRVELGVRMAASFGWAGVDLFFVLSGYLITGILLKARGAPGYYRTFYVRRTLRIFPLYYGYCMVIFLVLPFLRGLGTPGSEELTAAAPWYLAYAMNVRIALANSWEPATVAGTAFFWSLCVEEQFYLLWPATVARLSSVDLGRLCVALIVIAFTFRLAMVRTDHAFAAYVLLPSRMDGLAIGAWLAVAVRRPGMLERLARLAPVVLASALLALLVLIRHTGYTGWDNAWMSTVGMTCTAIASAALIVLVVGRQHSRAARFVSLKPLRVFGRYAYGLYVLGGIAALLLSASGLLDAVPGRVFGTALPTLLWHLLLTIGLTMALALLSFELFEQPALRLKRYFPYREPTITTLNSASDLAGVSAAEAAND
jgi:peptidoglycan/LPS O-acetylase OafA/YrhL